MAAEMSETVYGTNEEGHVMSDKVQTLAGNIYKEFERMIKKYDEDVVKELMPLVVGMLESLDLSYAEKQEIEVELELLRDDNEQLLTQYEREKQLRKAAEQKYLESEDSAEGEKKELQEKVDSLESILRMLELKAKNTADHVSRLDEKETEMKKEYNKLHERYTELFKTHMDYMERAKILMGTDRIADLANSPRTRSYQLPNLRSVSANYGVTYGHAPLRGDNSLPGYDVTTSERSKDSNISLRNEIGDPKSRKSGRGHTSDASQETDRVDVRESSTATKKSNTTEYKANRAESDNHVNKPNHVEKDARISDSIKTTDANVRTEDNAIDYNARDSVVNKQNHTSSTEQNTNIAREEVVESEKTRSPGVVQRAIVAADTTIADRSPIKSPKFVHRFDSYEEDTIGQTLADIVASTPELDELERSINANGRNSIKRRNNNSLFDELATTDNDIITDVDFGADITGREVNPGDYASSDSDNENDRDSNVSDNFFGMGKELENLILENTELLATKNALNIVKDDLIAKVDELTSEQEILREEITSVQVVKGRLQLRITLLEEDLKKAREELDKKTQAANPEEEDDVPMAQRKRFTRVEMARVLMERNQYKERLMELQEAVRWTEMIRASREHPDMSQSKKRGSMWNFFSNLFSSSNKPSKRPLNTPVATIRYNAPTTHVQPVGDPNRRSRSAYNLGEKDKAYEFLQADGSPVNVKKDRERERKEQYKQVRAHVKKDDGRMQAYGWSLPAKFQPLISRENANKNHVPVPVPVYCRPLLDKESGLKIWCAAGINIAGGRTRDGGSIYGASVFYSSPPEEGENRLETKDKIEKLNQELKDHEKNVKHTQKEKLSSLAWICTSTHACSRVTIIDANNPADILESFRVTASHILCVSSVPGATETDYPVDEEVLKAESEPPKEAPDFVPPVTAISSSPGSMDSSGIGGISFVQCAMGPASRTSSLNSSPIGTPPVTSEMSQATRADIASVTEAMKSLTSATEDDEKAAKDNRPESEKSSLHSHDEDQSGSESSYPSATVIEATGSPASSGTATPPSLLSPTDSEKRLLQEPTGLVRDGIGSLPTDNDLQLEEVEKMSSVLPTIWLGSQSRSLYVHSAVSQWRRCIHSVKLRDSVLSIVHVKGRVLVALADGTVAIFHRASDGQWDLRNYHLLDLGRPHHSIRCMDVIANKHVWCGYRNKIHVVDPRTMTIEKSFDAHPRKESQVRQLAWVGDGVWVSIRLDSTLRLYHAYTHQHLQDVDIEPYVSKMLGTGKLGFSFVRITAMLISCNRLWIGTGNGVIISVPLSECNKQQVVTGSSSSRPGGIIRVYSDSRNDSVTPATFIPYCTMAQAQLSFHGHRDAVKFFVAVPGASSTGMSAASVDKNKSSPSTNTKLVMSGGEGYIDFRIADAEHDEKLCKSGDGDDDSNPLVEEKKPPPASLSKGDRSHLIVWQVTSVE